MRLTSIEYNHSKANYSLYYEMEGEVILLVLIYVEGLLISGNIEKAIRDLKKGTAKLLSHERYGSIQLFFGA